MIFTVIEATSQNDRIRAMQFDYLAQPWLVFAATLAMISVCLFFLRTLARARPWNYLLGVLIVTLAIVNLAFSLTANLECRPLAKLWEPTLAGQCFDPVIQLNLAYFQGGFSVFSYLFLAIFPVMLVRDVELIRSIRWPFYLLSIFSLTWVYKLSEICLLEFHC
jgi:hypothetical protein